MAKSDVKKPRFLKTFFKERKQVGAVAPSSRFLVKKMCDKVDFATARVILELGPGTGVFTTEILKRARPDATVIAFELNDTFYKMLVDKFQDARLTVLHQSADEIGEVLLEKNIPYVDAIISSLPLAVIPDDITEKILSASSQALASGGKYVQYQYSLNSRKMVTKYFPGLKLGFVTINIPPAFIYIGSKA